MNNFDEQIDSMNEIHYSPEVIAKKGEAIYKEIIKPFLTKENTGQIVAIDIETKRYVIDNSLITGVKVLKDINPDAQIYYIRIGFDCVYSQGTRTRVD